MGKVFATLFSASIEEMYKLFKLGKDTDSMLRTTIKKTIIGFTLIMVMLTFLTMGQRLISLNKELNEQKAMCKATAPLSKNQPNAPSDSTLDDVSTYSLSGHDTHCTDNFCRQERRASVAEGFHGIKIRTHNE